MDLSIYKCGYVSIVGRPNAGKSTLINAILGAKLSIVNKKPQTTRDRILGILSEENLQVIFLDTPGVLDPKYGLHKSMMKNVQRALRDADLNLLVIDPISKDKLDLPILQTVLERNTILVVNKVDLLNAEQLEEWKASNASLLSGHHEVFYISALEKEGIGDLLEAVKLHLPFSPPFYPEDILSEHPERFFVSEIIREKILDQFYQEVPYSTHVQIVNFNENPDGKDLIDAEIIVERQTQKGILLGKGGASIKALGQEARKDIEEFLGRNVYLRLFVKVRKDWRNSDGFLKSFGFPTR